MFQEYPSLPKNHLYATDPDYVSLQSIRADISELKKRVSSLEEKISLLEEKKVVNNEQINLPEIIATEPVIKAPESGTTADLDDYDF